MKNVQHSGRQLLLLLLALIGAGISVYLTTVHYANTPLICSNSGLVDCARVLSSSFSVVPGTGVPISVPGLLWCLGVGVLAATSLREPVASRWLNVIQFLWALLGMFTVLYLVYVEIVLLHTICAWCTTLHVFILLIFLVTMVQLQQGDSPEEADIEEEKAAVTTPRNKR